MELLCELCGTKNYLNIIVTIDFYWTCTNCGVSYPKLIENEMRKTHDEIMIEKFEKEYPQLSQSFKKVQEEQYRLFASKMSDYGLDNIALGTKLETKDEKKMSLSGIFFRMNDKINRWKTFLTKGEVQNESLTDTYKDLSNYGLIALLVEKDQWKK